MKVVELPSPVGIVATMRRVADEIEAGEHPELRFIAAVFVGKDSSFTSYSWGPCSTLEAIGALARAVSRDLVDE